MRYLFIYILAFCTGCSGFKKDGKENDLAPNQVETQTPVPEQEALQYASGFDFPVGKPDAKGYYNAQPFGENSHLGDDWNAVTGGNSDLGDPIYSIGRGKVVFAENLEGGWGRVVRIKYYLKNGETYEAIYAHCERIMTTVGDWVEKGQQIATIGNADGVYLAHLHLEIRDSIGMGIGNGYATDRTGYVDPTAFINANRSVE